MGKANAGFGPESRRVVRGGVKEAFALVLEQSAEQLYYLVELSRLGRGPRRYQGKALTRCC
nr:hypothetical protein [uncultured Solibaculum sp.]